MAVSAGVPAEPVRCSYVTPTSACPCPLVTGNDPEVGKQHYPAVLHRLLLTKEPKREET